MLVYRKATDFCKLLLYPATLWKPFVVSRMFLVEFFGYFSYVMSSANRDCLTTSFPICIPFISYSCLISLAWNSISILNGSRESGHPFVPEFRGNAFRFSPFSMILAICLSYIALLCWGTFLWLLVSSELLSWMDIEFYWRVFLYLLRWSYGFCLCVSMLYYI
jgi:hypothetical protein